MQTEAARTSDRVIKERLNWVIDELGLPKTRLCELCSISTRGMSKYLAGQLRLSYSTRKRIADTLDEYGLCLWWS